MAFSNRDYICPECGGWMESDGIGNVWYCDTCDYVKGEEKPTKNIKKSKCNCDCDCDCK